MSKCSSVLPMTWESTRPLQMRRPPSRRPHPSPAFTLFSQSGALRELFTGDHLFGISGRNYDPSPDGKRFLMLKPAPVEGSEEAPIVVVLNWLQELERLVPTR